MPVCKSGRTTGLTCSEVSAIDVSIGVMYCGDCEPPLVASFTDQIMVKGGDFVGPGDSGSYIVNADDRMGVGLVFAASKKETVANPIDAVLDRLSLWTVGQLSIIGDENYCGTQIDQPGGGGGK